MLRNLLCQAEIAIEIEPVDPVLVKSGYATLDGPDMVPVSTFRNGERMYYLPGTSLKGVLRSHFERIARTLRPGSVCLPYYDPKRPPPIPVQSEKQSYSCGFRSRKDDDAPSAAYADSCAACRLFGSLKFAGRFSIGDAYPMPNHEPAVEARNGVGIDRFTGGAVRGVLFDLQALVGGRFATRIRVLNFEIWQLAVLILLLTDLEDEMIAVGSGRSRGLGRVRAAVTSFRVTYSVQPGALAGIGQLATPEERQAYGLHAWKPDSLVELPNAVRRGLRWQFDLSADWSRCLQSLTPALDAFLHWHGGPQGTVSQTRGARPGRP